MIINGYLQNIIQTSVINKQKNISIYVSITPSVLNIWNLLETINYFKIHLI